MNAFAVTPDSREVYFTAEDGGNEKLYSTRVGGGTVQTIFGVEKGSYSNLAIPAGAGKLVLYANWESASAPGEIALVQPQSGKPLVLTKFNAARAAQLDLPADRTLLVHQQPRQAHPQFRRAATGFRSVEEISAVRDHPWRSAWHVARPVLRALELPPAGRARLRAAAH